MPTTIESLSILRRRLRSRLGNPDSEVIDDSDLDTYLNEALDRMNRDRPATALSSFPTVVDQEAYDVMPANAYGLRNVFWVGSRATNVDSAPFAILEEMDTWRQLHFDAAAGQPIIDNPAMVTGWLKKLRAFKNTFSGVGLLWPEDGSIHLNPTPTSVETVWFEYSYPRFATLSDVQQRFRPILMDLAQAYALEAMAHQRSNIVSGKQFGMEFRTGGGNLQVMRAQQLFERYEAEYKSAIVKFPRKIRI